jgi:purine-nucleoside phosphorylase
MVSFVSGNEWLGGPGRLTVSIGHSPSTTVFPIRILKLLGIELLLVTNAAGGLNPSFNIGDFMIISDHVSVAGMGGKSLDCQTRLLSI